MTNLNKEDIDFLKDLCERMNTQNNRGTRAPVGYVIREKKREICPSGYEEGDMIWDDEGGVIYDDDSKEDWKEFIDPDNEHDIDWDSISSLDDLHDVAPSEYSYGYYRTVEKFGTNVFLTEEAIKKHLEANYYHYQNYDTYGIHFWRNPEMAKLLELLYKITGVEDKRPR